MDPLLRLLTYARRTNDRWMEVLAYVGTGATVGGSAVGAATRRDMKSSQSSQARPSQVNPHMVGAAYPSDTERAPL